MLQIGHFSRISQVSIQTLRYYDTINLLKPAQVDRSTGYRYYSLSQLPRLHRILVLKDLGLSLKQIGDILEEEVNVDQMRGMLRLRRAALADQMLAIQARLDRVDARLRYMEQEGIMPEFDVVLKTVEPILVASRRITVTENNEYPVGLPEAFQEVRRFVQESAATFAGVCIAVWYTPVYTDDAEDVEAAFAIDTAVPGTERITIHTLPAETMASLLYQGPMDGFMRGYEAILRWIEDNQYAVTGPFREIYHKWEGQDDIDVAVEIQFPVQKE